MKQPSSSLYNLHICLGKIPIFGFSGCFIKIPIITLFYARFSSNTCFYEGLCRPPLYKFKFFSHSWHQPNPIGTGIKLMDTIMNINEQRSRQHRLCHLTYHISRMFHHFGTDLYQSYLERFKRPVLNLLGQSQWSRKITKIVSRRICERLFTESMID